MILNMAIRRDAKGTRVMKTISATILVLSGLTFQCGIAFSDEIQEIKCRVVSISMEMDHDASSRLTASGSDIDKTAAEQNTPKECLIATFTYGNGVFDIKDFPPVCWEVADVPLDFKALARKFYPLGYKNSGSQLKFEEKKISVVLPEIGKAKITMLGYYDLNKMTFNSNMVIQTRAPAHVISAEAVSQCR